MEDQICISHFSIREIELLRDIEKQVSCRDLTLYNCGRWLSSFIDCYVYIWCWSFKSRGHTLGKEKWVWSGREHEQVGTHQHELECSRMDRNMCQSLLPLTVVVWQSCRLVQELTTHSWARGRRSSKRMEGKAGWLQSQLMPYIKKWPSW